MPKKGRPRLVASKASGTKLFVDDLREVVKLSETEPRKTISDTLRELVHEALINRRLQAFKRDRQEAHSSHAQSSANGNLAQDIAAIKNTLATLTNLQPAVSEFRSPKTTAHPLLTEILGFTIAAEMKSHLLLHNFLLSRGLSEEAAQNLIAEQETRSRQNTERILLAALQS